MIDRLDRTLTHFVDDGRLAPDLAAALLDASKVAIPELSATLMVPPDPEPFLVVSPAEPQAAAN